MRQLLIIAGTLSVGAGIVGIFVPLLPTTPFLLLAAGCYARSSPRMYNWLVNNRWTGKYIRDYREHRGVSMGTKVMGLALLWVTIGSSIIFVVEALAFRLVLFSVACTVSVFILSLKTVR